MGSLSQMNAKKWQSLPTTQWSCPPPGMAVCFRAWGKHSTVSRSSVRLQATLTLSCLWSVIMSAVAGVDQYMLIESPGSSLLHRIYSLNVLGKREWPEFYSAGCGTITLGIPMFSYYPAAPAEIAVLPWAAAYPYWQADIPLHIPPHIKLTSLCCLKPGWN